MTKSGLKQQIFDNTNSLFAELKDALHEFSTEIDEELDERIDKRIRIEYSDRGKFEAQIQIAKFWSDMATLANASALSL